MRRDKEHLKDLLAKRSAQRRANPQTDSKGMRTKSVKQNARQFQAGHRYRSR